MLVDAYGILPELRLAVECPVMVTRTMGKLLAGTILYYVGLDEDVLHLKDVHEQPWSVKRYDYEHWKLVDGTIRKLQYPLPHRG